IPTVSTPDPASFPTRRSSDLERRGREIAVYHLGFLQTQYVRSFLVKELLDDADAEPHRIDVPGSDLHGIGHRGEIATQAPLRQTDRKSTRELQSPDHLVCRLL